MTLRPKTRAAAVLALALGTLLTIGLLELGLRAAGLLLGRRPVPGAPDGAWTVLCLGDSFTYTGDGNSYPDQLARRFTADGVRVRIINRGVPGLNSYQLADMIEGELDRWKPDAAIVLIGADNFWTSLPIRDESSWRRLDRALLSLRTWKLLKLLWIGIHEGTLRARYRANMAPRDREQALETVRLALMSRLDHPEDWYRAQLGDAPETPRVEAAVQALAERLASDPEDSEARTFLGEWKLAQGDARGAETLFRDAAANAPCHSLANVYSGLAKALERLEGEAAARAVLDDADGRCPAQRRMAKALWLLWRGEPEEASALLRAQVRADPSDLGFRAALAGALYQSKDYAGAAAAYRELSRSADAGKIGLDSAMDNALLRLWEIRRAKDPRARPPAADEGEMAYSWFLNGDYARCAESAGRKLRRDPLSIPLFHTHALCLKLDGRLDDVARTAREIPALRDNLMYRYYEAQRVRREASRRPLEELEAEQFRVDMERVARTARLRKVRLILSSYPEEEYAPVRRTADSWGLPYADIRSLFRARFRDRRDFLAADLCHCNIQGFAVMAREYERLLRALPGFPAPDARR
ncbi:MAG: GDSL-type esterase/lipase family protein [Elusimicrobiota bacterium]